MAAGSSTQRYGEWNNNTMGSTVNQKSALSAAYAELGKELMSGKLKSVGSYTLGKVIGEGTYGKVRLGTHRLTGTRVAIKQVPKAHSATLTREIHHHRRLHHPNVMQLYEVMATESYIWMVTELCAGGELYDYLVERSTMPEPEARRIFGQLCLAVAYVHDRGIVHRDLKLENVLLDERCNVKVGDFGFTREYEAKKLMETFCGTTGYAAPEMLAGRKYTGQEVDIWSLGVILYALLCGALPFDDDDDHVMKHKIMKGEYEVPEELSEESKNLITSILQQNPSSRPTIKDILNHPWFHKTIVTTPMSTVEEDEDEVSQNGAFFPTADTTDMHSEHGADEGAIHQISSRALPPVKTQPESEKPPRSSLSGFSEVSFISAESKSDSESSGQESSSRSELTEPTTEEESGEKMHDIVSSDILLNNLKGAERGAALALHRNESQSTIRRQSSSGSDGIKKTSAATNPSFKVNTSLLATHHEAPNSTESSRGEEGSTLTPQSIPLEKRGSQSSSSRGQHHRTPSRSKRISSGSLAEPIPPTLDFRPIDYISLLEQSTPAMFSTVIEQNILHQLSSLGMDVGQIVHSVINEACDASGAMWWILKKKAEERYESTFIYSPLSAILPLTPIQPPLPLKETSLSRRSSRSASPGSSQIALPTKTLIKPSPVYASTGYQALSRMRTASIGSTREDTTTRPRSVSPPQPPIVVESPMQTPTLNVRPAVERHRTSSLSILLSNALSGKDKENKWETTDSGGQAESAGRSKSPVGALLTRMSGNSPTTASRNDKEKEKQKTKDKKKESTKFSQALKIKAVDNKSSERISSSSRSSPMRSNEDSIGRLAMSTSNDTFATLSSLNHLDNVSDESPAKSKGRSSFLSTFRTWFEDKDKLSSSKRKQQQQQQKRHLQANAAHVAAQHIAHGPAHHTASRSNSLRRMPTGVGPYPPSARSPRHGFSHRSSLSRRSSSGSNHHPLLTVTTPRPKMSRRPSAGSITPTATMSGDEFVHASQNNHRGSRPSSAQSAKRPLLVSAGGLHGRSGSASSSNSILRQQQQLSRHGFATSSTNGRRSSLDGGTVVRRQRRYPSPSPYSIARSDSGNSRPTTPSKLRITDDGLDGLGLEVNSIRGRNSPSLTPRMGTHGSVFVAHRNRTAYKAPSSSTSTHHELMEQEKRNAPLRAWRRSWGKPPPFWVGPVDVEALPTVDVGTASEDKPKLRNVFANKEADDDWEDEEEEPVYAGGLGQLDSCASQLWSDQSQSNSGSKGRGIKDGPNRHDGMPGHLFGSSRYAGVRSIFQPPSLGKEVSPKAWTTLDGSEAKSTAEEPKENGMIDVTSNTTISSGSSRVRAAAPAFKGADILEEEEEEEDVA